MTTTTTNCPRCGQAMQAGQRFCPSCGSDISGQQTAFATAKIDAPPPPPPPRDAGVIDALRRATVGDYDIMGLLGRGGMATVYLAHDLALDRKVAIKVMAPHLLSGEGMAERFKREARTAGSLSHPHIIPIYAVKEAGDLLFFVMKFVEGRPLDRVWSAAGHGVRMRNARQGTGWSRASRDRRASLARSCSRAAHAPTPSKVEQP